MGASGIVAIRAVDESVAPTEALDLRTIIWLRRRVLGKTIGGNDILRAAVTIPHAKNLIPRLPRRLATFA